MPGQLSNYLKNFNKVIDNVSPYVSTVGNLLSSLNTARNVFVNLNKFDDPHASQKDKAVNIAQSILFFDNFVEILFLFYPRKNLLS
jgi:phospholipase/lecithinase/hemolysin